MNKNSGLILPIEGLRGVAVTIVVLYHLDVSWALGGFVGVDVFFVISGFLISNLLLREYKLAGKISLSDFYARRARRILPAATIVLVATVIGANYFLEPLRVSKLTWDAIASSSFWANALFASRSIDYLAASLPPSPLQHYWSLSVEEQFYLFFPTLIVLGVKLSQRDRRFPLIVLLVFGLSSLLLGISLTNSDPAFSFFHLPSRSWQFIAGAAIPFTTWQNTHYKLSISKALPIVGLLFIAYSVVFFDEKTAYPGFAALIPTVGAVLIVLSSASPGVVGRILSHPALLYLGSRSFSLYLWHWPVIVFAKGRDQTSLPFSEILLVLSLSAILAELTHRLIENPIRFSQLFGRKRQNSYLLASALICTGVGSGVANKAFTSPVVGVVMAAESTPEQLSSLLVDAVKSTSLPANLDPPIERVFIDEPDIYQLGCHDYDSDTPITCDVGDPNSQQRLALFGDSHAAQWFEPIREIAVEEGWYLLSITRSGCSSLPQLMPPKCEKWYENALQSMRLARIKTVVTSSLMNSTDHALADLRDSLLTLRRNLLGIGAKPVFLEDTPKPHEHVPICLSAHKENIQPCNLLYRDSITEEFGRTAREVFTKPDSAFIPTVSWFCIDTLCPSVVGNSVVYRDESHITTRYAELITPELLHWLQDLVAG